MEQSRGVSGARQPSRSVSARLREIVLVTARAMSLGVACQLASAAVLAATTVTDDTGQRVILPNLPQRIISLAPGATEMLFAAGAGNRLIATVEFALKRADLGEDFRDYLRSLNL